jgi:hypothetical protein
LNDEQVRLEPLWTMFSVILVNKKQVLELADCGIKIEDHYSKARGSLCPMDIEWALGIASIILCHFLFC